MSFTRYTAENRGGDPVAMIHPLVKVTSPDGSPRRMVKFQCDAKPASVQKIFSMEREG